MKRKVEVEHTLRYSGAPLLLEWTDHVEKDDGLDRFATHSNFFNDAEDDSEENKQRQPSHSEVQPGGA